MNVVAIIALAVAIPVILFPAAYVWYMNLGGMVAAVRGARAKRLAQATETTK